MPGERGKGKAFVLPKTQELLETGQWTLTSGTPFLVHKVQMHSFGLTAATCERDDEELAFVAKGRYGYMVCKPRLSSLDGEEIHIPFPNSSLVPLMEATQRDRCIFPLLLADGVGSSVAPSMYLGLVHVVGVEGAIKVALHPVSSRLPGALRGWEAGVDRLASAMPGRNGNAAKRTRIEDSLPPPIFPRATGVSTRFALGEGDLARQMWLDALLSARQSVAVCAYGISEPAILAELARAKERLPQGAVRVMVDHSHQLSELKLWEPLAALGARNIKLKTGGLVHPKMLLVDASSLTNEGGVLVSGSYNPTATSFRNWENCSLQDERETLDAALSCFDSLWARCGS